MGTRELASLRGELGVPRRAPAASDRVDPGVARSPILEDGVVDLKAARRVRRPGKPIWVAPSASGEAICQFAAGELDCPVTLDLEEDGAAVSAVWHAEGPVRVSGIVTDSVRRVEVVERDGSVQPVEVVDNQFLFEAERLPASVRWTEGGRTHEQELPVVPGRS